MLTAEQIADSLGADRAAVASAWPLILAALEERGINTPFVQVAAAATISVEVGLPWKPIREFGGKTEAACVAYFEKAYGGRKDLGNLEPGDGPRFRGRGFIQITGRANYAFFGQALGIDLLADPDKALDPSVAARILALYFADRGVARAAAIRDWLKTRARVNGINRKTGQPNGWTEYQAYVSALLGVLHVA